MANIRSILKYSICWRDLLPVVAGTWLITQTLSLNAADLKESAATLQFREHSQLFKDRWVKLQEKQISVFLNPDGFASNLAVIEGDNGLIVIDAGVTNQQSGYVMRKVRKYTDKPVTAIVYTHHHMDHIGGAGKILSDYGVADTKIIAAKNFLREYTSENLTTAYIWTLRAVYQFGTALRGEAAKYYHLGCCGPFKQTGEADFVEPNTFVGEGDELTISGVKLRFFEMGGESGTGIGIYLPQKKVVFVGDEIQGPTFPQLHAPRGTKFRDANRWVAGLDKVRGLALDYLVSSHGDVQRGAENIYNNVTLYRDAIQYTHDQAVRYINKGYDQDELAEQLSALPEHLRSPLTGEFYGTVASAVRNMFTGYISWLSGDAADINPLPKGEYARRMLPLMGGAETVLLEAEQALYKGEFQWAAELATLVLNDHSSPKAKQIKSQALIELGKNSTSSTFRSWYFTSAMELQGDSTLREAHQRWFKTLLSEKNLNRYSGLQLLRQLRYRVKAESAGRIHVLLGYRFSDTQESYTVELRNGILEVREGITEQVSTVITMPKSYFEKIFRGESSYEEGLAKGELSVSGPESTLSEFYRYIENDYPTIQLNLPKLDD